MNRTGYDTAAGYARSLGAAEYARYAKLPAAKVVFCAKCGGVTATNGATPMIYDGPCGAHVSGATGATVQA